MERVSSFKYLGVNISEDLTWTTHIQTQVKKARQRLYHLRQLRKFRVSPAILKTFYSGAIESVLKKKAVCTSLSSLLSFAHPSHPSHPSCLKYYLLSPIYCFCTSYLFCTSYCFALFFILLHILLFISFFTYMYMLLCGVTFI